MERETFESRLIESTNVAVDYAGTFVLNHLPRSYKYLLFPNQSYDGNPLVEDEQIYPEESLPQFQYIGPLANAEVISYLWREGKVPEWVDINVHSVDEKYTYLRLLCCGRFTATEKLLYHQLERCPPFHRTSPYIPPGWESLEKSGKFDVHWMQNIEKGNTEKSFHRTLKNSPLIKRLFGS